MTTRVELANSHTNTTKIRVREVTVTGDRIQFIEGPPELVLEPGQKGARRVERHALLVELLPDSPAEG